MADSYLPKDIIPKELKSGETIKIISPPAPPIDIDRENRITALNAAVHQVSGATSKFYADEVLEVARQYENYLKGE